VVDTESCKVYEICQDNVISMSKEVSRKGCHFIYMSDPEACTGCTNFGLVCPDRVITVNRMKV
jgi:2-oxoglutarate ferredoxin oxidoreductase subunit delta